MHRAAHLRFRASWCLRLTSVCPPVPGQRWAAAGAAEPGRPAGSLCSAPPAPAAARWCCGDAHCALWCLPVQCSASGFWTPAWAKKKKKGGEERLLINFNSTTQQYSITDLFLFAQGVFQVLLPNFQHLLELPSLFLLYAFLNFTMNCSNDVKMIIPGPWQNLWK